MCDLIPRLHDNVLGEREIININVPDIPYEQLKGIKVTKLGYRESASEMVKQIDPRGESIYWVGASGLPEYSGNGTDFHAVANGYVSLTPIQTDMTAHQSLQRLHNWVETN